MKRQAWYFLTILLAFWWLPFSVFKSQKEEHAEEESPQKMMEHVFGHVGDHHAIEFGDVFVPLPVIIYKKGDGWYVFSSRHLYDQHGQPRVYQGFQVVQGVIKDVQSHQSIHDFSITKNVVWIIISILLLLGIFIGLAWYMQRRRYQNAKGLWVLPLWGVRFVRDEIAREQIGEKHYRRFMPYLLTLFFYILFNNLLGLFPGGGNITGNITITLTLAFLTFLKAHRHASSHYWRHIVAPPVPKFLYPIMIPMEIIKLFLGPTILGIRLCISMLSGHLIILSILAVIFILKNIFASVAGVAFITLVILLKIFISYIQAYMFTTFAAVLFGRAVEEHGT